jgi:predicted nucleic acid-binding protein
MNRSMNTLNFLDANVWLALMWRVWIDAYLLAFASVAGLKLVTFDRGLRSRGTGVHVL